MYYDRDQSEFNDAANYIRRINALFANADESSMELNAFGWFQTLMALYRELSTKMKDTKDNNEFQIAELYKTQILNLLRPYMYSVKQGSNKFDMTLYDKLHQFELFLRRIYHKSGLEGRSTDDPSRALR
jgi:hypothetical protein